MPRGGKRQTCTAAYSPLQAARKLRTLFFAIEYQSQNDRNPTPQAVAFILRSFPRDGFAPAASPKSAKSLATARNYVADSIRAVFPWRRRMALLDAGYVSDKIGRRNAFCLQSICKKFARDLRRDEQFEHRSPAETLRSARVRMTLPLSRFGTKSAPRAREDRRLASTE